ncbi:MAG: T9SS type A sorting domain-containing protein, partial [Ignavibacteriae bacterium]|nr:T9SS type A sorting domain-containing protein [Ignavibacteriota bacterium]
APVLSSPVNGAVSQPIDNLSLIWNASQNAVNYHLQVSLNSSFSSFVIEDASLTNTQKIISGLSYSTTYYWRVKAINSGGASPFSSVWSFTTVQYVPSAPLAPVLSSPNNGAVSQPIENLSLIWSASQNAANYHLQVSLNSSFSSFVIEDASLTNTLKIISGLSYSTTYYWRVKAKNSGGESPFSSVWSFTTTDAPPNQWVQYNTGVPYSLFGVDFASYDANLGVAVGQGGTVIRTTNGGVNWTPVYSSINIWLNDVKFDPNAAGTVWAAGMGGVILKSIDGGINWSVARAYDTPDHTIRGIGIPDNYHNYVAFIGYAGTFFETTNAGNSFVQRTDIPFTMHSIAFSPDFSVNGKGIISGTDGKAWNTTNFGTNWVARNTNRYDYLNDVVYLDAVTAVICGNNGTILKSNNSGTNWTVITQTLTTQHFRSIDAFAAKVTICGDNGTILTSNDGGITFVNQLSGETRHLYGVSLKSSLEGTTVGEIGGSVSGMMYFTMRNGFTAVTGQGTELPDKFELKQNFPNPFNPSTTIMFDVLKQSKVTLRIYNVLGKEVAVLVDREMSAASGYKVKFDASALPSGVYFYRLQAGDFVDTKRMLLIK